ncbi:MAG: isoprenylcysteine carboxylmethyltransferase family protein [Planctomycetes bacterium]|nr:isoprenylcysteine carboxylmethyltransferase family protein [Planctomycetota bacterium]
MKLTRFAILVYGVAVYALFLLTFVQAVAFVSGVGLPWSIDDGMPADPRSAVLIDCGLLLLFAVQHNVMARRWFKRAWTRVVPAAAERSTFVLLASLILQLLFRQWRDLPGVAWSLESPALFGALAALQAFGWGLALLSTFLIDHFELFGLRQVWEQFRGRALQGPRMHVPLVYRQVRHPLMLGFLIAMWSAPHMTVSHLLFSGVVTMWVLLSIRIEERDLVAEHGASYRRYRERVPMLLPRPWRRMERDVLIDELAASER